MPGTTNFALHSTAELTIYGHDTKTAEQRTIIQQYTVIYIYIWYSD